METAQVSKKRFYKRTWFWILIGVVFFVIVGSSSNENSSQQSTPAAQAPDYVTNVGEEGYLKNGQDEILVSKSNAALDAFTKAAIAKDNTGMMEVVTSGQAFFVKAGTKVLVIGFGSLGVKQIRILEGQFAGKAGFVPREFVKRQPR